MLQVFCGLSGLACSIVLLNLYGKHFSYPRSLEALCLVMGAAAPMLLVEGFNNLLGADTFSTTSASTATFSKTLVILGTRVVGLVLTMTLVCFFYWQLQDYHFSFMSGVFGVDQRPLENSKDGKLLRSPDDVPHLHNFFRLGGWLYHDVCGGSSRALAGVLLTYLTTSQLLSTQPVEEDGFYVLGRAFLLPLMEVMGAGATDTAFSSMTVAKHALEMCVRAFYGPVMFCAICDNLPRLHLHYENGALFRYSDNNEFNFMQFFDYAQNVIFTFDLTFACVGYLSPVAYLSVEPTALGWASALVCYNPFYTLMHDRYFNYLGNRPWNAWFDVMNGRKNASAQLSFRLWGCAILLLQAAFAACTASYGLRYSNLAYRTVVSTGPYWFLKHPAYVTKILSFAMIHVPFVDVRRLEDMGSCDNNRSSDSLGWGTGGAYFNAPSIRYCFSLTLFACVYVIRARTEEAHLLQASGGRYAAYVTSLSKRWAWW